MQTIVSVTPLAVEKDTRTFKIAASLARAGYRSIVMEGARSAQVPADIPFELRSLKSLAPRIDQAAAASSGKRFEAWQKRVPWWSYEAARAVKYLYRYNLPLARALPRADLYYLHAPYQFPVVWGAARRHGAGFVYDAHDFYPVVHEPPSMLVWWIEKQCVDKAAEVVTVSHGVADLIESEFGRKPLVLRNSQDSRLEREPGRRIRESLGLSADAFCIVTTGNPKDAWKLRETVDAMAMLPPHVHLLLLGNGYEAYRTTWQDARVRDRVHIVPAVAPAEVVPFIRGCDAFILSYGASHVSYLHSLPNKFFHGVAAGMPVLYPILPEMVRIAEEHGLGIAIDPGSPESIVSAVLRLLDDPAERARLERNVLAAQRELSWERDEERLLGLVRGALNGQGGSSRSRR